MHRPKAFAVDDVAALHRFIREQPFGTIAVALDGAVVFAYAPVVLDAGNALGSVRFHLAANNPLAGVQEGTRMHISFAGPNAYVSPDWYASHGLVPTWNYIAVEGEGYARFLNAEELRALLTDLSAEQEAKLSPKTPWTVDKVPPDRLAALTSAIVGISVLFEKLEGKFKLSQDKSPQDIAGVMAGLEGRGGAADVAVAKAMREDGDD